MPPTISRHVLRIFNESLPSYNKEIDYRFSFDKTRKAYKVTSPIILLMLHVYLFQL
jgi:hypothetical protein